MTINKNIELTTRPSEKIEVSDVFKIDSKMSVKRFKERTEWVPEVDDGYIFDKETTLSILAGFSHNRRVMI
ncbi:MAG: cobaltochelatase subunit CobS, partial [Proteobacteria bacterium]|nr:cobaltochelatase subunit CobS [Pseudomonadota bacterium]